MTPAERELADSAVPHRMGIGDVRHKLVDGQEFTISRTRETALQVTTGYGDQIYDVGVLTYEDGLWYATAGNDVSEGGALVDVWEWLIRQHRFQMQEGVAGEVSIATQINAVFPATES